MKVTHYSPPYKPHPAQEDFHYDPHRFRVLSCGRRWGKTLAGILELWRILQACKEDKPIGWVVAPTYPLSLVDWDTATEIIGPLILNQNSQDHWMEILCNDPDTQRFSRIAKLEFKTAEREDKGLRGRGLSGLLVDEAAWVGYKAWTMGLRPALADKRGKAVFISTPSGRNLFWELFMKGKETSSSYDPEWKSWQFPSISNPYFPKEEWDRLDQITPLDIWKQEYLAEFLEDESAVFHGLSRISGGDLREPLPDLSYSVGADLARKNDFTVIIAIDNTGQVTYAYRSREVDWSLQRQLLRSAWAKYTPSTLWLDSSGPGDVIEDEGQLGRIGNRRSRRDHVTRAQGAGGRQSRERCACALLRGAIRGPDGGRWILDPFGCERLRRDADKLQDASGHLQL